MEKPQNNEIVNDKPHKKEKRRRKNMEKVYGVRVKEYLSHMEWWSCNHNEEETM